MFVVSITYKVDLSEVDKYISEHVEFLDKFYEQGNFLASGRKVPRIGGVILAKADNKEDLNAILAEDPFYKNNLAEYEITEFIPTKYAAGLDTLT
jgi:uncharacterized protein YciI